MFNELGGAIPEPTQHAGAPKTAARPWAEIKFGPPKSTQETAQLLTLEYFDECLNPLASDQEVNGEVLQKIKKAAVETVSYVAQGRLTSDQLARFINRSGSEFSRRLDECGVAKDDKFRMAAETAFSKSGDAIMQGLQRIQSPAAGPSF